MVTWPGTKAEADELLAAANTWCMCKYDVSGERLYTCDIHHLIVTDQHFLNVLVGLRRTRVHLHEIEESPGNPVAE